MSRKIVVEEDDDAEWIAKLEKRQEEYETKRIFNFTEQLTGIYCGIGISLESFLELSREVQLFIIGLYYDKEHLQGTLEEIKDLCA
mgnify:CR=1 FL=1|tara:strand:+ start:132 stop:389 length:258 start_codon:yes stop_codon:yes gene_type:complete